MGAVREGGGREAKGEVGSPSLLLSSITQMTKQFGIMTASQLRQAREREELNEPRSGKPPYSSIHPSIHSPYDSFI